MLRNIADVIKSIINGFLFIFIAISWGAAFFVAMHLGVMGIKLLMTIKATRILLIFIFALYMLYLVSSITDKY